MLLLLLQITKGCFRPRHGVASTLFALPLIRRARGSRFQQSPKRCFYGVGLFLASTVRLLRYISVMSSSSAISAQRRLPRGTSMQGSAIRSKCVDETATRMHCRLSGAASAFSLALRIYDRTTESCWKESQGTRTFVYWIRNISLACAKRSNELLFPIGAAFLRTFETSGGSFNLNWTNCSADGRAVLLQAAPSLRRDKVLRTHIPCHQIVLIALHA